MLTPFQAGRVSVARKNRFNAGAYSRLTAAQYATRGASAIEPEWSATATRRPVWLQKNMISAYLTKLWVRLLTVARGLFNGS